MPGYVCDDCGHSANESDDCCTQCDGRIISSVVKRQREEAIADAVDALFEAYHAGRTVGVATPTLSVGGLFKRQAS